MPLQEYRRKRDFKKTPEPRGKRGPAHKQLAFLIQKHDASHLHYDFRLELDGVLKSWAVPKGPDLDPAQKRLAMQVEDHPLEYGNFEGTIPKGQYGGGTVMLWDRGTWEPIGDAREGLHEGHLKFILHGEKLRGRWMLVRRGGRRANPASGIGSSSRSATNSRIRANSSPRPNRAASLPAETSTRSPKSQIVCGTPMANIELPEKR